MHKAINQNGSIRKISPVRPISHLSTFRQAPSTAQRHAFQREHRRMDSCSTTRPFAIPTLLHSLIMDVQDHLLDLYYFCYFNVCVFVYIYIWNFYSKNNFKILTCWLR